MAERDGRISVSGAFLEQPALGYWGYGVPVGVPGVTDGRLAVTGGAVARMQAADGVTVHVGAAAGYSGAVALADAGSRLELLGSPVLEVGREGGNGALFLLSGTTAVLGGSGPAALRVGNAAGAGSTSGLADVLGGVLRLSGASAPDPGGDPGGDPAAELSVALDGARGRMRLLDDGLLSVRGNGGGDTLAQVGAGAGADGRLEVAGARALIHAAQGGAARLALGVDGGAGVLDISGPGLPAGWAGAEPVVSGVVLTGGAAAGSTVEVGRAGTGRLTVEGGLFAQLNTGQAVSESLQPLAAADGPGGPVRLHLGTEGGAGVLEGAAGAWIEVAGATGAELILGAGGGSGVIDLAAASLRLDGGTGDVRALMGPDGAALLRLGPGGTALLRAGGDVLLSLGAGAQAFLDGALTLQAGGAATLRMTEGALLRLAARGELSVDGAALSRLDLSAGGHVVLEGGSLTVARIDGAGIGGGIDGGSPMAVLAGHGTLQGPSVTLGGITLNGVTLRPGDLFAPDGTGGGTGDDTGLTAAAGTLTVPGDLTKQGGTLRMEAGGPDGGDLLEVGGRLTLTGTALELSWQGEGDGLPHAGVLLARATGGIELRDLALPEGVSLSVRDGAGGGDGPVAELWAEGPPPPPATMTVTGRVRGLDGRPLDGAVVTFTPADGDADPVATVVQGGAFSLELPAGSSGRIDASLDVAAPTVAVGTALNALRLAVGLSPVWGPARPHDFIAADITGDGRVGSEDALVLLRLALGLGAPHAPRWVFVDADADLGQLTPSSVRYGSGIDLSAPPEDELLLTGILIGRLSDFG